MAIFDRIAVRAVHRSRSRVDRFKLTKKPFIRQVLLTDDAIAEAVKEHSAETSVSEAETWRRVEDYIDEIVPFFNILTYYKIGMVVSRVLLNFFYKVSAEYAGRPSRDALPRDAIVIYLMNHRSNADYVLVGYVLSGQVAISYAVGEWARTFPLEYIFKSFGAYFVRRKYREKLYHTVLERYVQLITSNGVTQGIFLEGGLSRDGRLGKAKIGLLDYLLGVARDPELRQRLFIVPVAINYDRVLEDRSLLRELDAREGPDATAATDAAGRGASLRVVEQRAPRRATLEALWPRGGGDRRAVRGGAMARRAGPRGGKSFRDRQSRATGAGAAALGCSTRKNRRNNSRDVSDAGVRSGAKLRRRFHFARAADCAHDGDARRVA